MEINRIEVRCKMSNQIKRGVVKRPKKCSRCNDAGMIIAHHHDYTQPYSVIWLCSKCHGAVHRKYDKPNNFPDPVDYSKDIKKYKLVKRNQIPGGGGDCVLYAYEETHTELKIMAAIRSITIKQVVKELVADYKSRHPNDYPPSQNFKHLIKGKPWKH